jgi:predicted methyltransferase
MLKKLTMMAAVFALSSNAYAHSTNHGNAHKDHSAKAFAHALKNSARPEADRKRDEGRKPQQIIHFAGIKPGMRVLDIVASGGYYTEVLSHRVGEKGEVLSHNNKFMLNVLEGRFKKEMDDRLADDRLTNVTRFHKEFGEFGLKSEVDAATMVLNYHDLYNFPEEKRQAFLNEVKTALKPGGIFLVIDMEGNEGPHDPKLHRLNSKIVKNEITAAGFTLADESSILANPNDDHKLVVFDPAIRGKADRYVFKFVKM